MDLMLELVYVMMMAIVKGIALAVLVIGIAAIVVGVTVYKRLDK